MEIFKIIVAVVGMSMSFAYFPQALKIYQSKSAESVSLLSYAIFCVGTVVYTVYGFVINDMILVYGFIFGVIGSWLVMGLSIYYKSKNAALKK